MLLASVSVVLTGCSREAARSGSEVELSSPAGRVKVSLKGGRILSWKDSGNKEVFFMPAKPESSDGDWSHGGISVCWPWFGRKGSDQSLIHGFARNLRFSVLDRKKAKEGESVTLSACIRKTDNAAFPYDATVKLTVSLFSDLTLKLETVNTGKEQFALTGGFQAYFPVSGYDGVVFTGIGDGDFAAVDGMDKAFLHKGGDYGFKDTRGGRIRMSSSGNSGVVVWTPGTVEPANRNLAADDCPRFIVVGPSCREAEGVIAVKPEEASVLSFSIRREPAHAGK